VLRQDPRFFQLGKGGFWHRTGYAVSRNIRHPARIPATVSFNASEIFGSAFAAGISTYSYHPPCRQDLIEFFKRMGPRSLATTTITIVVKEFWPDIRRKNFSQEQEEGTLRTRQPNQVPLSSFCFLPPSTPPHPSPRHLHR